MEKHVVSTQYLTQFVSLGVSIPKSPAATYILVY